MVNALQVNPNELIERAAKQLQELKLVQPPVWSAFVKTGVCADRPPVEKDWWFMRSAALLRSTYKLGPIGTSKLRTKYGGRKNRGNKPERFYRGSGSVIRQVLQQLEKAELVKQAKHGNHKGRTITPKGKSFLDKIAVQMSKGTKQIAPKVETPEKAVDPKVNIQAPKNE